MKLPSIKFAKTETLVLRCCRADLTSHGGFQWKKSGIVSAPDFRNNKVCGNGIHGWRRGEGDFGAWEARDDDLWLVLAAKTKDIVDLDGKVKFPRCRVLYAGNKEIATALISENCPGAAVIHGTATAGYKGTATAGYGGTATAGDGGTATSGYGGTATAGNYGTATAGNYGTATAGYGGTATAGYKGTATAGYKGTATSGYGGILQIRDWDSNACRYRIVTGYIGENGILPGKKYQIDGSGQFIEVV